MNAKTKRPKTGMLHAGDACENCGNRRRDRIAFKIVGNTGGLRQIECRCGHVYALARSRV